MDIITGITPNRAGSNSAYMAEVFAEILTAHGVTFELIDFNKLNILPYQYQDQIKLQSPLYPKDDFFNTLNKIFAAKWLILFSPVHWCSLAKQFRDFQDRYAEAIHRPEWEFNKKMIGKTVSYAMVSGSDPTSYTEAFWHLQERNNNYVQTNFIRGPWLVARESNELRETNVSKVMAEMQAFAKKLGIT